MSVVRGRNRMEGRLDFVPTRRTAYYIRLGYLAGTGHPSPRIAEALADGIHPSYVRTALRRAGIPQPQPFCHVPLTSMQRAWLDYKAAKAGLSPEAYLGNLVADQLGA